MFRILKKACFYLYNGDEGYSDPLEVMINPSEVNYTINADVRSGKMSATGKESNGLTQYNVPAIATMSFKLVFDLVDIYEDSKKKFLKTSKAKSMAESYFKGIFTKGLDDAAIDALNIYERNQSAEAISVYNPDFTIYESLREIHENQRIVMFICGRLPRFTCVITQMTPNIEYISQEGNPIRMSVDISLQELKLDAYY